jgi:hypothetical protein
MDHRPSLAELDKLKARIEARAKTIDNRDERVAFWVITRHAVLRDIVRHDPEAVHFSSDLIAGYSSSQSLFADA